MSLRVNNWCSEITTRAAWFAKLVAITEAVTVESLTTLLYCCCTRILHIRLVCYAPTTRQSEVFFSLLTCLRHSCLISHGIVTARLDYCNSLLHGTSARNLNRLQVAQNELARVVCDAPWSASATELRRHLHWLPVRQRIDYKLLSYKTRSTGTLAYLASLLESYRPARELRSSNKNLLTVPQLSLALSAKAFCVSALTVWNSLPDACTEAELVSTFRSRLKTELFNVAYVTQLV